MKKNKSQIKKNTKTKKVATPPIYHRILTAEGWKRYVSTLCIEKKSSKKTLSPAKKRTLPKKKASSARK